MASAAVLNEKQRSLCSRIFLIVDLGITAKTVLFCPVYDTIYTQDQHNDCDFEPAQHSIQHVAGTRS